MQDITVYNDSELSLIYLNTESYYIDLLTDSWQEIEARAREDFIFTDAQLDKLQLTWDEYGNVE